VSGLAQTPPSPAERAQSYALRLVWLGLIFGLPALFILVPLVSFLLYGFWIVEDNAIVRRFTLANYAAFLGNETYTRVFAATLLLALRVMLINLLLGYPVAYFLATLRGRIRYILVLALIVPLLMSYIIKIYAMRGILGPSGLLNQALIFIGALDQPSDLFLFNMNAVLITMSVIMLPFMILPVFIALERIPKSLLQASADLGATPWQTFRRVILPMSLPGAVIGAMFCFILATGDFLAPELVGGTQGFTFGRLVFSQFGMAFNWPLGAALSVVLLIAALAVIAIAGRIANPRWMRA
jgi:spermidine/putrescine transport system permease protein